MTALGRGERAIYIGMGSLVLFFLLAPMGIIALASLDPGQFFQFPPHRISLYWYRQILRDEGWVGSIKFTLIFASLTALCATFVGCLAGIAVGRVSPRIRRLLYPLVVLPLAVPSIVIAVSFYGIALRLHMVGNLLSFVVANTLLTVPLVALFVSAAMLGIDRTLEFASLSCGAGPLRTLVSVVMPSVLPAACAGGVLAFLATLDEVVVSGFLVGPEREPLAVKLFLEVKTGASPILTTVATLLIVASFILIGVLILARGVTVWIGASTGVSATDEVLNAAAAEKAGR